jgi:hypothetical protein
METESWLRYRCHEPLARERFADANKPKIFPALRRRNPHGIYAGSPAHQ